MITYVVTYTNYIEVTYKSKAGKVTHRKFNRDAIPASVQNFMDTAKSVHQYGEKFFTYSNRTFGLKK